MWRLLRFLLLVSLLCGTALAEWELLEPGLPVLGLPGESVLFRVQGPAGQSPSLRTTRGETALRETSAGVYEGHIRLPAAGKKSVSLVAPKGGNKPLGDLRTEISDRYYVAGQETVTRQGPHADYDRLTPLYAGQKVPLDGSRGGWHRCRESGTWLDGRSGMIKSGFLPPNRLQRILLQEDKNGDALIVLEGRHAPEIQVSHSVAGGKLQVRLENTLQTNFDVKRVTGTAPFLGPVILRPKTDGATELELSCPNFAGYQIEPQKDGKRVTLRVRKPLARKLAGLKITIDAGHGGPKDTGAMGVHGLAEKTLNLRVAKVLASKLQSLGAQVTMTRTTDTNVANRERGDGSELQARIDRSIEAGAQIFLSVHHNARPSIAESRVYHGTDMYWYQPHSQALAQALADPVADAIGEPTRSYRWRSFYVIRQTHAPAVLMEFQYISNPTLEKSVLSQADYPDKAASGVVEGLLKFLSQGQ